MTNSAEPRNSGQNCGSGALRYVLDVPANTLIRDLGEAPAAGKQRPPWRHVDAWAKAQPSTRLAQVHARQRGQGPKVVRALEAWVQTKDEGGRSGRVSGGGDPHGRWRVADVVRPCRTRRRRWPLFQVVGVQGWRHGVEELLQAGKGKWVWATTKCAVGWLAPSHDPVARGPVVPVSGEGPVAKKNPGLDGAAGCERCSPGCCGPTRRVPANRGRSERVLRRTEEARNLPRGQSDEQFPPGGRARRIERLQ